MLIQCPNPICAVSSSVPEAINGRGVKCKRCGTPFKATPTIDGESNETQKSKPVSTGNPFPTLPAEFGRYHVTKLLGRGGMGAVYLARDTQLGRQVALKLPSFDASDTRRVERFVREAQAAAGLMHPNICPVFDAGKIDGRPFITMGYIDGNSLDSQIDPDAPMDETRAAGFARKVAAALHAAHETGIVHRDLKPANVMLSVKGEPVVMDFGLAKRVAETDANEAKLTHDGAVMGTPSYMAPEQVKGELERIGPATDVYSLGVMLFEMLTGRTPYTGPLGMVMGQILIAPVRRPSELRPDVDPQLDEACHKAMAKDPADRFPNMVAFGAALDEFLKGPNPASISVSLLDMKAPATPFADLGYDLVDEFATATPKKPRQKVTKVPSRLPLLIAAGFLGLVLLVCGIMLSVKTKYGDIVIDLGDNVAGVEVKIDGARVELTGIDKPITLTAGEHGLTVTGADFETVAQSFTVKKGEKQVVKVTLKPKAEVVDKVVEPVPFVASRGTQTPAGREVSALDVLKPSFIPDAILAKLYGSRTSAPPELVAVYDTGRPDTEGYHGVDISPDGRLLATSKFPLKVVIIRDIATGQTVHRFQLPSSKPFAYWLKFAPDGKTLYGIQHEFLLHAWNLDGQELWKTTAQSDWSDPALSPDGNTLVTSTDRDGIQVLDPQSGAVRSRWPDAVNGACRLAYSRDGSKLVAIIGRGIRLIDPKDGSVSKTISLNSASSNPAFSNDGKKVYTSHVWKVDREHVIETDIETGEFREYCHTNKGCRNPEVHPTAPLLATVSSNGSVQFWDMTAGPEQTPLSIPIGSGIHKCVFTPDGRHAVAVASTGIFILRIPVDEGVLNWIARRTGRVVKIPTAKADAGFTPLFNGKDLTGWAADGDCTDVEWKADAGGISIAGGPAATWGFLLGKQDYTDFVLRMQFQQKTEAAKSGVIFRGVPGMRVGKLPYQCKVNLQNADNSGATLWGNKSEYKAPDQPAKLKPVGEWNDVELDLRGQILKVTINGDLVQTIDFDAYANQPTALAALKRPAGRIGLQKHLGDVKFRNIEIKETAPVAAVLATENSEWAGAGMLKSDKREQAVGGTWTFTERRGEAFKALWRSGTDFKIVFEGTVSPEGRLTLQSREQLRPTEKPREEIRGIGELAGNRMTVVVEEIKNKDVTRVEFKRLPDGGKDFKFQGRWKCNHVPRNWNGFCTITDENSFSSHNGSPGKYTRDGGLFILDFLSDGGREWLIMNPDNPNELQGVFSRNNVIQYSTWTRE